MWLVDALVSALDHVDLETARAELAELVPEDIQRRLAKAGVRDEYVFPTPSLLVAAPTLLGYYRLLLGVPQKSFYTSATGLSRLKRMETHGVLKDAHHELLPALCAALAEPLAELVRQLPAELGHHDLADLQLLILGSQFQGANNNAIGKQATLEVFLAIAELVDSYLEDRTDAALIVRNASDRRISISLAADPDVRVDEDFGTDTHHQLAIEIKGGTDKSNAHNRAGEAEKSHQKAKAAGYREFWTIIGLTGLDRDVLKAESPTTQSWFDATHVLARSGEDWESFRARLAGKVGIPLRN